MDAQQIMDSEEFKKCADFHGHVCPGLSIGFKAAKLALEKLRESRADDEEMVAIVETDACGTDAVQVLTGCTLGKGNLVYKDYGKNALTLFSRKTGRGVRVAMRPDAFPSDEAHLALLGKVMSGEADETQKARFRELHHKRSLDVLAAAPDAFFTVSEVQREMPARARVEPSEPCSRCGEPTMRTKLEPVDGNKLCRGCLELPG
jgi:formylmethanofuran dehydrogenase subunit E